MAGEYGTRCISKIF